MHLGSTRFKAAAVRTSMWVASFGMAAGGVVASVHINKATGLYILGTGLYVLGGAMCLTIKHHFASSIREAEVAAALSGYVKGREHHDSDQAIAPVVSIRTNR